MSGPEVLGGGEREPGALTASRPERNAIPALENLDRMAVHTVTTKAWDLETAVEKYARAGVSGITVWFDAMEGRDPAAAGRHIRDAGLDVVATVRGGFFPSIDPAARERAVEENIALVRTSAALGAPSIVLVCGAEPNQALEDSREQIAQGIARVAPAAREAGVKLSIEPLHPMFADTRSAVTTLQQATDMAEAIGDPGVGVAVDVYHLWMDPKVEEEIDRCGRLGRLFAFHVCDWRVPTEDLLLDRGLMGEGCIDVPRLRARVDGTGFTGYREVEVFSRRWWAADPDLYMDRIVDAYRRFT